MLVSSPQSARPAPLLGQTGRTNELKFEHPSGGQSFSCPSRDLRDLWTASVFCHSPIHRRHCPGQVYYHHPQASYHRPVWSLVVPTDGRNLVGTHPMTLSVAEAHKESRRMTWLQIMHMSTGALPVREGVVLVVRDQDRRGGGGKGRRESAVYGTQSGCLMQPEGYRVLQTTVGK
jgi:hypothetical protein